ncbi:MAG TPA: hypothetical protein VMU84_03395 [Thermoanaerobaculia bacterium]|nr:hypothetical protein [Thermoanaerobaculia bacterium]
MISARTAIYIVVSLFPAILAFAILTIIAKFRSSYGGLVPGWLAAAAIAPALSTFFGVRLIFEMFRGFARWR